MHSLFGPIVLLAALFGLGCPSALAETVVPKKVKYTSEVRENDRARVCEITLDIENPVPPELVRFAAFVDYEKAESAVAVGFRIGAAKRSTAGDFERVRITGATIESATFTSADEMDLELYGEDAFTAATADGIAASRLLKSVISGKFSIDIFVVEPRGSECTYEISSEPPAGVRLSFEDCLEKTMPGQALLRASPVRLGR